MKNEMLTRSQADGRIRGAARVASGFCWVAALVALLSALFGAWSTVVLTTASMEETGHDAVTAFFATSKGSQGFLVSETEAQPPQITYDEDGNEVGRSQVMGSTVYLAGSPVSTFANGVFFGGLACAGFVAAALMCAKIRRTGAPFAPERARELGRVGWLVLLAGCAPTLIHMLLEAVAMIVVNSLLESGEILSYALTASFEPQDLMLVSLGILLVLVGRVFEYGCILQKQDDETL